MYDGSGLVMIVRVSLWWFGSRCDGSGLVMMVRVSLWEFGGLVEKDRIKADHLSL